ncbi:hypothetical protein ACO22_04267 [Paracoccidioides brasiliensis]|uniref:Uncharacterized protein n=1 Tax=Paracoccidioides brasiliensis TaxID=121759 RepID=A0A1D2JDJ4_PARBR|nr:hypothetical protein ACO22_04267 [Paracoccidioides brasiliensis]
MASVEQRPNPITEDSLTIHSGFVMAEEGNIAESWLYRRNTKSVDGPCCPALGRAEKRWFHQTIYVKEFADRCHLTGLSLKPFEGTYSDKVSAITAVILDADETGTLVGVRRNMVNRRREGSPSISSQQTCKHGWKLSVVVVGVVNLLVAGANEKAAGWFLQRGISTDLLTTINLLIPPFWRCQVKRLIVSTHELELVDSFRGVSQPIRRTLASPHFPRLLVEEAPEKKYHAPTWDKDSYCLVIGAVWLHTTRGILILNVTYSRANRAYIHKLNSDDEFDSARWAPLWSKLASSECLIFEAICSPAVFSLAARGADDLG